MAVDSLGEMRRRLHSWWHEANAHYVARRDSLAVFWELDRLYRSFDAEERLLADRVFGEWLNSEEPGKQWDARAMIDRHHIRSAIPQLESHIRDLIASNDPMAPAFAEVARRILDELIQSSRGGS